MQETSGQPAAGVTVGEVQGTCGKVAVGCWYTSNGRCIPKMIRYEDEDGSIRTVTGIRVISEEKKYYNGNLLEAFICKAKDGDREKLFALLHHSGTNVWRRLTVPEEESKDQETERKDQETASQQTASQAKPPQEDAPRREVAPEDLDMENPPKAGYPDIIISFVDNNCLSIRFKHKACESMNKNVCDWKDSKTQLDGKKDW